MPSGPAYAAGYFIIAYRNISSRIAISFLEVGCWTKETTACQQGPFQLSVLIDAHLFPVMVKLNGEIPHDIRHNIEHESSEMQAK
jgi:hypothetical protein